MFLFSGLKETGKKKNYLTVDEYHSVTFPVRSQYLSVIFPTLYGKKNYVNSYILNTGIQV